MTEVTEVAIVAAALNRMLGLGRPNYVRIVEAINLLPRAVDPSHLGATRSQRVHLELES
jgi:hypothetical protein